MTDAVFIPQDQCQRERITSSLDETLFVEAGAGTGKTEALVGRIVALISTGRAKITGIAAITFTELSAAELRARVRARLLDIIQDTDSQKIEKSRCTAAIRGFDAASIETLHSFAGQILRERPLDIGLPPSFEVVEAIESDVNFQDRWNDWLNHILDNEDLAPTLSRAMALGLRVDQLREVSSSFHEKYDLVAKPFPNLPLPSNFKSAQAIIEACTEIVTLLPLAHLKDDPLAVHCEKIIELGNLLEGIGSNIDTMLGTLARFGRLNTTRGRISDWDDDPESGVNGCKTLKAILKDLEELRSGELDSVRASLICQLLEEIRRLAVDYAHERLRSGKLEFQDLLILARDLLRDNPNAKEYFYHRFTHILIDEFQDTDPIQAEIALLLTSPDVSRKDGPIQITPGKLFVVGDPKQSIYMFRGADISVSENLKKIIPDGHLALTQNFRSQSPIISWLNILFEKWMKEDAAETGQVDYHRIFPRWDSETETPSMGVRFIGSSVPGPAPVARDIESKAIANAVSQIKREKWLVRDGNEGDLREAKYQDICLLLPTRTGLGLIESALSEFDIPYRLESQSMVLETQVVRDLIKCLRSIDSPADQIALVAALRSAVFACSDVDLFEFAKSGAELDYTQPVDGTGPVHRALQLLGKFHTLRLWITPEGLIERFVRETRMVESCFGFARPRERWRRIRFVIDRAAAFGRVSTTSLRSFIDWIERQTEQGARMIETPVPEPDEDAVRVMTIHASKGLEFPIVILGGLGAQPRSNSGYVLYDRNLMAAEVSIPALGNSRFNTPGYENLDIRERGKRRAERTRQMYVAATRAQDHIIVSLFRPEPVKGRTFAAEFETKTGRDSPLWSEMEIGTFSLHQERTYHDSSKVMTQDVDNAVTRQSWLEHRGENIRVAALPSSIGATGLAKLAKEEAADGDVPYRKGRGGTNLGRAVHSTLQSIDLSTGAGSDEISQAQAAAEGIPNRWKEVVDLVKTAIDSNIVRKAVASGRYFKEVYVGAPVDSILLEGFIDLLFQTSEGLTLVDYKTDGLVTAEEITRSMDRYRLQGGAYALALEKATGRPITRVVFLFLHTGTEVVMDDLPAAIRSVEGEVCGLAN